MKKDSVLLTFFGDECFSHSSYNQAPILEALAEKKLVSALVVKKTANRSRRQKQPAVLAVADQYGLPTFIVQKKDDLKKLPLPTCQLGLVASFGLILPPDFMSQFSHSIYNLHPSLLPLYRGVSPVEGALLAGASETGMTLMRLDAKVDTGAIIAQEALKIDSQLSKLDLTQRLAKLGLQMLLQHLPAISQVGGSLGRPQKGLGSYTTKIRPSLITDLSSQPALYWQRYVRAYQECPNNRFLINDLVCELLEVGTLQADKNWSAFYSKVSQSLNLRCQQDYLSIQKLKPASRAAMSAAGFVNGFYKEIPRL